jgi:tetratricopeptide (TPR) repeat protein
LSPDETADLLGLAAGLASDRRDFETALQRADEMLALCGRTGNHVVRLEAMSIKAIVAACRNNHALAAEITIEQAGLARELRAHRTLNVLCRNAAHYLALRGRLGEAAAYAEESLATSLALRDWMLVGMSADVACWIYRLVRAPVASARVLAGVPEVREIPGGEAARSVWLARGHHAAGTGNHAEAARCFRQSVQFYRQAGNAMWEQLTMPWLICALVQSAQFDEAQAEIERGSSEPYRANGRLQSHLLHCRALQAHAQRRPGEAIELLLRLIAERPAALWLNWACLDAAWLQAEAQQPAQAQETLNRADVTCAALPQSWAVAARVRYAAGDLAGARQCHRRYLQASGIRGGQDYFCALERRYAGAAGKDPIPPAPHLPSRL